MNDNGQIPSAELSRIRRPRRAFRERPGGV